MRARLIRSTCSLLGKIDCGTEATVARLQVDSHDYQKIEDSQASISGDKILLELNALLKGQKQWSSPEKVDSESGAQKSRPAASRGPTLRRIGLPDQFCMRRT